LVGGEKTFAFVVLGEMQSVEELSDLIGVGVEGQVQSIVNSNEKRELVRNSDCKLWKRFVHVADVAYKKQLVHLLASSLKAILANIL